MAPPTKRRKLDTTTRQSSDLTNIAAQHQDLAVHIRSTLSETSHGLPPVVAAFLESVQKSLPGSVEDVAVRSYQASKLSLQEVKNLLEIDYDFRREYRWSMKEDQDSLSKPLSGWADVAIAKLLESEYSRRFRPESITRTMFDILLCDRLELLDDAASGKRLRIVPEASMDFSNTSDSMKKTISGRADWALGYMDDKDKLHEMLVVLKAKTHGNIGATLPQLLAYLACVQDVRSTANKTNKVVFGLATDFIQFQFAVLRQNRKVFLSRYLDWYEEKDIVVAFLDHILQDAIESSPHTTPTRFGNKGIRNFDKSLEMKYNFGGRDDGNDPKRSDKDDDVFKVAEMIEPSE